MTGACMDKLITRGITKWCLTLALLTAAVLVSGETLAQSPSTKSPLRKASEQSFPESVKLRVLAVRLRPGQDLRQKLEEVVKARDIRAGFILTAVGSLRSATIRLADQKDPTRFEGKFEIVSLVGTMGQDGVHLHISIADKTGKTLGGHLVDGCPIYTTAEIVIGDARGLMFSREQDEETGYKELRIRRGAH
jgi:predicted DNA-binding protein with PD1-like motif